jgi:hypothetical protein
MSQGMEQGLPNLRLLPNSELFSDNMNLLDSLEGDSAFREVSTCIEKGFPDSHSILK